MSFDLGFKVSRVMKHLKKNKNRLINELEPTSFLDIVMNKEVAEIIQHCMNNHIFYGIFPVAGNSMTCNDYRSIPDGSGVLVYDLQLDMNKPLSDLILDIPINQPVAVCLGNEYLKYAYFIKTISVIDTLFNRIRLSSYNPQPEYYDRWVSIHMVRNVYKVIQVIKKEALEMEIK